MGKINDFVLKLLADYVGFLFLWNICLSIDLYFIYLSIFYLLIHHLSIFHLFIFYLSIHQLSVIHQREGQEIVFWGGDHFLLV